MTQKITLCDWLKAWAVVRPSLLIPNPFPKDKMNIPTKEVLLNVAICIPPGLRRRAEVGTE